MKPGTKAELTTARRPRAHGDGRARDPTEAAARLARAPRGDDGLPKLGLQLAPAGEVSGSGEEASSSPRSRRTGRRRPRASGAAT